ncbi:MAG: hypothetical protein ACREMX_08015, partial [Gemmatimonadales bacterium]
MTPEPQPLRIPATSIDTLWARGSSAKTGAILGGVIGTLAGVGHGLIWSEMGEDVETSSAVLLLG